MFYDDRYVEIKKTSILPYLPLKGNIDFTYRCNNNCRHCWIRIPQEAKEKKQELSFKEIKHIIDKAKALGCRKWHISGGEPMLRSDFLETFDYITSNCASYSINTNGTLITPKIARLMKRNGINMVVLYGATAGVHDHITRSPGSFEAAIRGFTYLKEAGAGFLVQLIPMKDNYHQFKDMVKLAESLSKNYRIGASWLFLSASGEKKNNEEIMRQRLPERNVVQLEKPDLSYEDKIKKDLVPDCRNTIVGGYLFYSCINSTNRFHIDSYGKMTFCYFIKDPALRFDLRKHGFKKCWEDLIPSLAKKVKVTEEYRKNCGSCSLREDCFRCPAFSYLEHRRFNARIDYLCAIAKKNREFKDNWQKKHRRYYRIADITIQVDSDQEFNENSFHPAFKHFEVSAPGEDTIAFRYHFSLPDLNIRDLGKEFYRKLPWAVYKKGDSWIYASIKIDKKRIIGFNRILVFNSDHTRGKVYQENADMFKRGNLLCLTLVQTDLILLARILADRQGCYLHCCGVDFKGKGLIFAGHSRAGKSTIAKMFKNKAKILCDDRIIIRKKTEGFKIYGTWQHGEVEEISAGSVPLKAILFLKKSKENRLLPIIDKKDLVRRMLDCLVKPLITVDWWEKTLLLIDKICNDVPCYVLEFDKSGEVLDLLEKEFLTATGKE